MFIYIFISQSLSLCLISFIHSGAWDHRWQRQSKEFICANVADFRRSHRDWFVIFCVLLIIWEGYLAWDGVSLKVPSQVVVSESVSLMNHERDIVRRNITPNFHGFTTIWRWLTKLTPVTFEKWHTAKNCLAHATLCHRFTATVIQICTNDFRQFRSLKRKHWWRFQRSRESKHDKKWCQDSQHLWR